ncbi:MAG: transcriptional regulator NrdR [Halobacteria archaeon]
MKCPNCETESCRVIDSRPTENSTTVRRRRQCRNCDVRFTTYERAEWDGVQIKKRSGDLEGFDKDKLLDGIKRATEKRPVNPEEAETIAEEVETMVHEIDDDVIDSRVLGEHVSSRLKDLDEVAYLRFVSVYKEFSDPSQFAREVDRIEDAG